MGRDRASEAAPHAVPRPAPQVLRVAHITETFLPRVGGIETALATLLRALPEVDHRVLTTPVRGSAPRERLAANVLVERLPPDDDVLAGLAHLLPRPAGSRRLGFALATVGHILRERSRRVRASDAHVVHIHGAARARYLANWDRVHGMRLGRTLLDWWIDPRAYGGPVLFTDHSLCAGSRRQFADSGSPELLRRLSAVVCVERTGLANATAFAAESGLTTRIWHIPNPIDTDTFVARPMPGAGRLRVGYAGRAEKEGIDRILPLLRAAPERLEFRLVLSGDPAVGPELPRSTNVTVEWNVPNDRLPAFYAGLHVFLDPLGFGAPRTSLEALSSGRPVVRLRSDGDPREDLPDDIAPAVRPEPGSVLELLRALDEDRVDLERRGRAARAHARESFDARVVAARYRDVYHSLRQA
ncbi:MAG: glycosyltransferase family 4 protein [Methanobacteriota archaeon]